MSQEDRTTIKPKFELYEPAYYLWEWLEKKKIAKTQKPAAAPSS